MTTSLFLFVLLFTFQDPVVPWMSTDDFTYELEYDLKDKPVTEKKTYDVEGTNQNRDMLAYLKIHFNFLQFENSDNKLRIYKDGVVSKSKKIKGPMEIILDMGFAVDIKAGLVPSAYTIYIEDENKKPRVRIGVVVKENGELLINDVTSGML